MVENTIPLKEIVADLRRLSETGASGAVFISTSDNRSAQVALDRGKIVYLYYAGRLGMDALEDMPLIESGRYRFQAGSNALPRVELPETASILLALESGRAAAAPGHHVEGSSQGSNDGQRTALTSAQKAVLQACLADFVGPIAELLCDDHLSAATDLEAAIDALAKELPSSAAAQQFRAKVGSKLG